MNVRPTVTSVPMINLKLPLNISDSAEPIRLERAKDTQQLFVNSKGMLEYRNTNLMYSWSPYVLR